MNCLSCHATTTNGLGLCELCTYAASEALGHRGIVVHFGNLARQRKPARPNGSLGGRGTWLIKRGEVSGSVIDHALSLAANDLATWARALHDDRPQYQPPEQADTEAATVAALCASLAEHLTTIACLEWAGQFVRDTTRHYAALRELTRTVIPGWYAGACRICTAGEMRVVPGDKLASCRDCGATTFARDSLAVILEEASGWVATPKRIAEAVVALSDSEPSVAKVYDRVRQWANRGDLEPIYRYKRDHVYDLEQQRIVVADVKIGRARYRFGDVFDLLTATRPAKVEQVS
ncbi:hypothetical protein [Nocardioides montaniterrae]